MQTILLPAVFAFIFVTSCSKQYICECKNSGGVFQTYELKDTKKSAKETCEEYSKGFQNVRSSDSVCALK